MERPWRVILATLTILSLLLCIAIAALWVRSYWRLDSLMLFRPKREWTELWIDHKTIETFRAGPLYEADFRRGNVRVVYLYSDGSYYGNARPAWISRDVNDIDEFEMPAWANQVRFGFAVKHLPVPPLEYNGLTLPLPSTVKPAYVIHAVYTPLWIWIVMFGVLPAARCHMAARTRSRRRRGLCPSCGYDLRATPERCPECGTAPPAGSPNST